MSETLTKINKQVKEESKLVSAIYNEIQKVIVGQPIVIERLLIGILAEGHVLLEGVPGLAKTLSIKTLAETINASFQRIQFTPDLLPSDILGTMIYNQKTHFQNNSKSKTSMKFF